MAYLDYTGLSIFLEKIKDLLSKKQNTLTFDTTPTSGSTNPVTSGGIYTSLEDSYYCICKICCRWEAGHHC